ncbi:MAG: hypothetical protein KF745_06160 [Phycisphaeraceae bacterium]|nr:hypothetical protein [Phycisphaeraceae bacterium]
MAIATRGFMAWFVSGLAVVATVVVAACANPKPEFRPAQLAGGQGVIYMFRPGDMIGGGTVELVLNQEPIGPVQPGEYRAKVLPPGEYLVRVEGNSSSVSRVMLQSGESAYLLVRQGALGGRTTIEPCTTEDGRRLIAESRMVGADEG